MMTTYLYIQLLFKTQNLGSDIPKLESKLEVIRGFAKYDYSHLTQN